MKTITVTLELPDHFVTALDQFKATYDWQYSFVIRQALNLGLPELYRSDFHQGINSLKEVKVIGDTNQAGLDFTRPIDRGH